jgi:hypothetical protein
MMFTLLDLNLLALGVAVAVALLEK